MYYYIVCFYNEELSGNFTVDFIYSDMKTAFTTIKEIQKDEEQQTPRNEWSVLYIYDGKNVRPGDERDYNVYLDSTKKKIYIFCDYHQLDNLQHSLIPLPCVT